MTAPDHPLLHAVGPLLTRIGATVVSPAELLPQDVPLEWQGVIVAGIRLPAAVLELLPDDAAVSAVTQGPASTDAAGGLDGIIGDIERHFGTPLADLSREGKQQAVRMFEEGGAFSYRKSVEAVAAALGVSRFTVYNYLNRDRE